MYDSFEILIVYRFISSLFIQTTANSQTLTHPSSSNINNSSIQTSIVKSGNVDGNNSFLTEKHLKSPPQYSSLHQTARQIRTQNAFVSSKNSVSNNCDSNSLNEIPTTVTSQTGVPASIETTEGMSYPNIIQFILV